MAQTTALTEASFEAVPHQRAFEKIISLIEEAILDGRLQPGDRLPAERDLAETFGVGRSSVREALRALEMFGVVAARRGTGADGGSIVAEDATAGLAKALRLHSGLLRISTKDLVDVRVLHESYAAEAAARRHDEAGTARLLGLLDEMRKATNALDFHKCDTEFHVELGQQSGNALMPVFMEAIRGSMSRQMLEGWARLDFAHERERLMREHATIVRCIAEGRDVDAGAAVRKHIVRFYLHAFD